MTGRKPSSVSDAPSLDAIGGADDDRVGRVDFSTRLGGGSVALTRSRDAAERRTAPVATRPETPAEPASEESTGAIPLILPPAKVDEELAAEAARIRREVAHARGRFRRARISPRPTAASDSDPLDDEAPTQADELAAALREHPGAAAAFEAALAHDDEPALLADHDDRLDAVAPAHPAGTTGPDSTDHLSHPSDTARFPEVVGEEHEVALELSVAEVAASVIASMRAVGEANERHLEAVELEAARRCELVTAQAELDAELIRLHARREAHAIISAARMRAGEDATPVEADQLSEIGETFSRFAESIETTITSGPAGGSSPDPTRTS